MTSTTSSWRDRIDLIAVWVLFIAILVNRLLTLTANELGWDVFGYYLPLPATFIHGDPLLADPSWIHAIREQYHTSDTLYQLSSAPDGSPMYFFLLGMAVLYAPFFFIGHGIAWFSGAPMDGFSAPYQVTIAVGCTLYSLLGLFILRKILRRLFSIGIAAAVILVIGFGTNFYHFASVKSLETASFLFCGIALLVWNTLRWHEEHRRHHLLAIAACVAMITLIKPSEIVCGLIPLLWGVKDRASLREKIRLLRARLADLLSAIGLGLLILSPQLAYWTLKTGAPVYDSYKNPGVGLDWWSPHVGDVLFSFRKGWLIYTPVMFFALAGLVLLWRQRRDLFWAIALYVLSAFYIIASWTEWWYGASFSIRPMITTYPVLAIALGFALAWIGTRARTLRTMLAALVVVLSLLNLFQTWQFNHWILHDYRTTRPYYMAVFGRTSVPWLADSLLAIPRRFDGLDTLKDSLRYTRVPLLARTFQGDTAAAVGIVPDGSGAHGYFMGEASEYLPGFEAPIGSLTDGDHLWLRARAEVFLPDTLAEPPCLVVSMERREGPYGYRATCETGKGHRSGQFTLAMEYLTPSLRSPRDRVKVYLWRRGMGSFWVRSIKVEGFVQK